MSNIRGRADAANRIRGPQSALTDFLASHNISAHQIATDYQTRVDAAARNNQTHQGAEDEDKENQSDDDEEDIAERKKRKRKEEKALLKIKQSKEFKRRKYEASRGGDPEDVEDDDDIARSMLAKNKPLPGQLENCEICEKRFTVTPYSKTGPDGGLLCAKCSKEMKDEQKKSANADKKKKAAPKGRRRQTESDRLMGDVKPGAKSLVEVCVKKVANVVNDIEDFGDLPQSLLLRLSQILSKKRVITDRTLQLFLRPDVNWINIWDSAKLETEDFHRLFAHMPHLEKVNLRNAGQLKDEVLEYMIEKNPKITHLQLGATNLISDEIWVKLFQERGAQLEQFMVSELDASMRDNVVAELAANCKNLKQLEMRSCLHMTEDSIVHLSSLTKLEHLTLAVAPDTSAETLVTLINNLGPNLQTLCLEKFHNGDDTLLVTIKQHCHSLQKLHITCNSNYSDTAFANLFTNWSNPPLFEVDFHDCRDIENVTQGTGEENDKKISDEAEERPVNRPIGFCSNALIAMFKHSGSQMRTLNLKSCRFMSHKALTSVFDGENIYSMLKDVDLSFVPLVDEQVMAGIFKSCPALAKLAVFACFNACGARIPSGIAVIGLPNPADNILVELAMNVD